LVFYILLFKIRKTNNGTLYLLETRVGSLEDDKKLQETFIRLGATVLTKLDLKLQEVNATSEFLEKKVDWKSYDYFVGAIKSHGIHQRFITSDCRDFKIEEFVATFSGKRFPGLLGKPKIFFLYFCRGHNVNKSNVF
jgi:caspase 7